MNTNLYEDPDSRIVADQEQIKKMEELLKNNKNYVLPEVRMEKIMIDYSQNYRFL